MSTTVAMVRMLSGLLKDRTLGPRIVPIVADEARTFGMANLFRQIGIYSPVGQQYEPEDAASMLYYREAKDGQLLEEGITEAGAIASWTAAATSYSAHAQPMLPFYIYYSMFGFQRVGDLIWAAADQRSRGFLLGATAGRTTLGGEGLQHQDGNSHLIASMVPNCRAYDPAFACELAVIVDHGMRRMVDEQHDEFFYITVMNENYPQPSLPEGAEQDIIKGMYRLNRRETTGNDAQVRLLGSGTILREVIAAGELLARGLGRFQRHIQRDEFQRACTGRPRDRALESLASGRDGEAQPCGDDARRDGSDCRGNGLRLRVSATHRALHGRAFRGARHRRIRAQRHPHRASALF